MRVHASEPRSITTAGSVSRSILGVCAGALLLFSTSIHAHTVTFTDLEGWWSAEPTYAGESSRVLVQFAREGDEQLARLSLAAIAAYGMSMGSVSIDGHVVKMEGLAFPLTYDADKRTLSGTLPEEVVPVYRIPVEFVRIESFEKPSAPTWNAPSPPVRWRSNVGAPVWAGLEHDAKTQLLFVGTDAGLLHAIAPDGTTRWTFETGQPIRARPAAIGDAVFVASDSGLLHKLDTRTGTERWRARIDAGSPARIAVTEPKTRWDRYASSIVADATRVYVGSRDGHLYALDRATGREVWKAASADLVTSTPALDGDRVLFASFDGTVQALNAKDGALAWRYESKQPISGDLAVDGDRVFAGNRAYDLLALDARTGTERWKHYYWFSWIESPPVVRDGIVYTGSSDATGVYAIDAKSGERRWKTSVPGYAWAKPAVGERIVIAGTVGQGPHPGTREGALVAIDRASGKIVWIQLEPPSAATVEQRREWGFASAPVLVDHTVYAADLNGVVYAIEAH